MWIVANDKCLKVLRIMPDNSVDSIVTDPPYELGFMGKKWDSTGIAYSVEMWAEALRVLRPGGYLLAFGGTRTYHRMVCAIEDAGFEIRDSIHWIYGSGFPKSLNVSKAIDKAARGVPQGSSDPTSPNHGKYRTQRTEGKRWDGDSGQGFGAGGSQFLADGAENGSVTDLAVYGDADVVNEAKEWEGWGTALKPAHEPIVMARKPFKGTVAGNVLEYGTGGINVDGCRIGTDRITAHGGGINTEGRKYGGGKGIPAIEAGSNSHEGRWPANLIFSHSPDCVPTGEINGEEIITCADDCPVAELDRQSGTLHTHAGKYRKDSIKPSNGWGMQRKVEDTVSTGNTGGASRFFYCAKASKKERPQLDGVPGHPTVKPLKLMRYLVRLVTLPGGIVLDMFAGSGTTGEACEMEGMNSILIDDDPVSIRRIDKRMSKYGEN